MDKLACILLSMALLSGLTAGAQKINVVTDLAHEFSFYADNRFHSQYLKNQKTQLKNQNRS